MCKKIENHSEAAYGSLKKRKNIKKSCMMLVLGSNQLLIMTLYYLITTGLWTKR